MGQVLRQLRAYCPTTLLTGQVQRELHGRPVLIMFGACPACAEKETA